MYISVQLRKVHLHPVPQHSVTRTFRIAEPFRPQPRTTKFGKKIKDSTQKE